MNGKLLAVGGVLVLLLAGVGGAFVAGLGPFQGSSSSEDISEFPTATADGGTVSADDGTVSADDGTVSADDGTVSADDGTVSADDGTVSADDGTDSDGSAASTPPFAFTVDAIEECGQTCRDVTSTLTNQQNSTAEAVTVSTRIYAGNDTDGDVVWEGSEDVGTLEAGESYSTTRRVDLSFRDAYAIQRADGRITVRTTVETTDRTVTFTDRRTVA
ncbi:hypothetical protein [Haloarcula sp. 1CSR25-25]|uniref:hypothetical protein n=1 Tax=Haloarcula sp. 1CSR25-25 TaxID=2862545 RepID=UPI0028945FFA|nr:hypothetical protein [Haloarcula sp. 1CSR25-25]MDT3436998.1 hypothetical protein [Haloarcula sp. 1CSR25-25]